MSAAFLAPIAKAAIAHPFITAAAVGTAATIPRITKTPKMPPIPQITPPKPPPAPKVPMLVPKAKPPTKIESEVEKRTKEIKATEKTRLAKKKKRTILTGPRGLFEPANIGFKTLLGE